MSKKLISIVCPVLNEEEALPIFYEKVTAICRFLESRYDFEFVFTDNCSQDRTFEILTGMAEKDPRVRAFRFSRNFGYQASIWTGYSKCRGEAAIQLDVDLQDPPEMIRDFLENWEQGFRVVYGVRVKRKEAWWLNLIRKTFYRALSFLSEDPIPVDAGDFRLVDRKVIEEIKLLDPHFLYMRGAIAQMGFRQKGIPYQRHERAVGASKFGVAQLFRLAFDGLLIHSTVPLRLAAYFGVALSVLTLAGSSIYIAIKLMKGNEWPAGFTTLTVFILLSLGINSFFLGVLGEYVGRMYRQRNAIQRVIVDEETGSRLSSDRIDEKYG